MPPGRPLPRVLVVDDEASIRMALTKFLTGRGYEARGAASGGEALERLQETRYVAMVCDVRMPGMTGLELVPQALATDPELAVMMLSALNDAGTATEALSHGAMDYLMKPVELADLHDALERVLHRRQTLIDQRLVERRVREEVAARTAELEREKATLRALAVSTVEALVNAQEAKDIYLRGHSQRVASLGAAVAHALGLSDDTVEAVRLAGRLHDVGKIGIREEVLNKPARLTPEEFEHVKSHVRAGMEILAPLTAIVDAALPYVHDHHEHWDGSGYPRGRAGEDITLGGRILCACDAYDALTSRRPYREPLSERETLDYLSTQVGRLLDPQVYAALKQVVEERRSLVFLE